MFETDIMTVLHDTKFGLGGRGGVCVGAGERNEKAYASAKG